MSGRYKEIATIIENFCDKKLNDEYKEIMLYALEKLCRKRPSPLATGKALTWACGIVYAIGVNNFIFDKSGSIYLSRDEISDWFGLAKSTAGNKAQEIRKILDIFYGNPSYSSKENIEKFSTFNIFNYIRFC
jgi:hypothetical protein